MSTISKESIINSLRKVNDPDLHKDLVTLNMVKDVAIENGSVAVTVELTTPACPLKDKIKSDCENAIKADHPGLSNLTVTMTARVFGKTNSEIAKMLPGVKNCIAVGAGKGGVGKSTVAVNLAVALAKEGASVGLLDADIYGPSIPLMLGINEKPRVYQNASGTKMLPLENYGIKLMSIGFLIDESSPVIWRGPMASGALKQFISDVEWDELDYLIFDLPPGTGDIQLTLCQTLPLTGAVIVTTPQEVALIDARKAIRMFERVNVPVLGVVENMSYFIAPDTGKSYDIFGTGGGESLAREFNTRFLGGIPIDPRIREGGDKGTPIVYAMPDSVNAEKVLEISRNLAAEISINNINQSLPQIEIELN